MGREREKFKNRSSISKVRKKPKSKKKILQNAIIAANWDQRQTLSQNYRRLGLTAKLNKQSGGVEQQQSPLVGDEKSILKRKEQDSLTINGSKSIDNGVVGEARVERDPETGRILRVLRSEEDELNFNPLNDPLNDLDSDEEMNESNWARLDNQHGNVNGSNSSKTANSKTYVVRQLEERANLPAVKHVRPQTENEQAFLQKLVEVYGDDYDKMVMDVKLNYMQRSAGDLKRRIKKWRQSATAG